MVSQDLIPAAQPLIPLEHTQRLVVSIRVVHRSFYRRGSGWGLAVVLAGSVVVYPAAAQTKGAAREAIRDTLPKYDPAIRAQALAQGEQPGPATPQPSPPTRLRSRPPRSASTPSEPGGAIELPEVVVEVPREPAQLTPLRPLPRVAAKPPANTVSIEPFASPAERDAQLVKRHLTSLDRNVLNRVPLFGPSNVQRAREAEAIAQNTRQLNRIADTLEVMQVEGADPEEYKKLKKLYLELYLSRPK